MITKQQILDAYIHLRTTNQSIPTEVLDFIKQTCFQKLDNAEIEELEKNYFIIEVSKDTFEDMIETLPVGSFMSVKNDCIEEKVIVYISKTVSSSFIQNNTADMKLITKQV